MKVYIIAAVSADGFIAKNSDELVNWSSHEDKKFFRETTKQTGVIVIGGKTYRTFKSPLPGRRNIVYSKQTVDHPEVETTQEAPEKLIKRLAAEGIEELAICGGSSIYSMFLRAGVVTDLYLSVEPVMFGNGIPLYRGNFGVKLELQEMKKMNEHTILLHYKLIKIHPETTSEEESKGSVK